MDEICRVAASYLQDTGEPAGPRLATLLQAVRARTEQHIAELQEWLQRIDEFEVAWSAELGGAADFRAQDPRSPAGRA